MHPINVYGNVYQTTSMTQSAQRRKGKETETVTLMDNNKSVMIK